MTNRTNYSPRRGDAVTWTGTWDAPGIALRVAGGDRRGGSLRLEGGTFGQTGFAGGGRPGRRRVAVSRC